MNALGYYNELNETETPAATITKHEPLPGRYVPKNSTPVTRDNLPAVVYTYHDKRLAAIAYYGKKTKSEWHYAFRTEAERNRKIEDFFENAERVEQEKSKKAAMKKAFKHGYKVGDILYSSWGYDQTNIEFFQIIATTEKQITFREIMQNSTTEGFMSYCVTPRPDVFVEKEIPYTRTVRLGWKQDKGSVSFATHPGGFQRSLWEYDGRPKHSTSYA